MKTFYIVYQVITLLLPKYIYCHFRVVLLLIGFQAVNICAATPSILYLSWTEDPAKSMVIQWVDVKDGAKSSIHFFKTGEEGGEYREPIELPLNNTGKSLKRVFLRSLEPNSEYSFTVETDGESSNIFRFKTMPETLETPVNFVVGGDAYFHYELFRKMNATVAKLSPDFVVLGGDIAYVYSHNPLVLKQSDWEWRRWRTFLRCWTEQMVDSEGRLIPFLAVVGNHDVKGAYSKLKTGELQPSLFYTLFPFEENLVPYREMLFGDYLALFLLDSGHTHSIGDAQADWLADELKEARNVPYKMAVYHIPAYPTHTSFNNRTSERLRNTWSPLFETYGVQVAFEHHNHTYKRTKPLKDGKVDPKGVVYLGDGSWGVPLRCPRSPAQEWYLEKSDRINAVYYVHLGKDACRILAIGNQGQILDEVPSIKPQTKPIAKAALEQ